MIKSQTRDIVNAENMIQTTSLNPRSTSCNNLYSLSSEGVVVQEKILKSLLLKKKRAQLQFTSVSLIPRSRNLNWVAGKAIWSKKVSFVVSFHIFIANLICYVDCYPKQYYAL